MGLLDWLGGMFGGGAAASPEADAAVERVIETVNPRLKLVHRYRARLSAAMTDSLEHVSRIVAAIPPARAASPGAWAGDPYLRAYFSSSNDLARAFGRNAELRAYFADRPADTEACVVLGMDMTERRGLGMGLEGDKVRADVAQTTLGFSDHRARICAASEEALRAELQRRLVEQLAIEGLARAATDKSRREELARDRALLQARLKLLEQKGAGMRAALGGEGATPAESARINSELERNAEDLKSLGGSAQGLEWELESVRKVLASPAEYLEVTQRKLRIDRMNVVQETGDGEELEFQVARVPGNPPRTRAFALVRFARADLPPADQGLKDASRLLG